MKNIFVLVQTRNYPEYIIDCVKQIRYFNNNPIFLLSDNDYYQNNIKEISNTELINIKELRKTENHLYFTKHQSLDNNFRNGFWVSAVERFFIIEDFLDAYNIENIIQVETDNLIYTDYQKIFGILEKTSNFSIILDHKNRCIPSIVYLKNKSSIESFNRFYNTKCLSKKLNDMEALALFYKKQKNKFLINNLPITPPQAKFRILKHIHNINYYNNFCYFNGIFDAAAFGQYLGGVDPKNIQGNTVGFINETSVVKPNRFKIIWEEDSSKRKTPFIYYKDKKYPIFNLHIHSKNLKIFMSE
ncbi:hypothetical protein [Treponema sp. J25]|uniref:hypothetical protein n=1 Tax=Treponema sp. J25 TaxID=2094121 RepID=UPI0010431DFA|nr:hypothetical protein [Treponema sp. J25]TCW60531.1 hypothetical protein C5O22_11135 [Treponema sp. J25]